MNVPARRDVLGAVERALANEFAPATARAVRSDLRAWRTWLDEAGYTVTEGLAPACVIAYLEDMLVHGRAPSTARRRLSSLQHAARQVGVPAPLEDPLVSRALRGLLRTHGRPAESTHPITPSDLRAMVGVWDASTPRGARNRTLLLVGFCGALRRSELTALLWEDVTIADAGATLLIRRSKGDAQRAGQYVALARGPSGSLCPVNALEKLRSIDPLPSAAVFGATRPHPGLVDRVVKASATRAGITAPYSAHSLRAGFVAAAAAAGVDALRIQKHTRHASLNTVTTYYRRASIWAAPASADVVRSLGL